MIFAIGAVDRWREQESIGRTALSYCFSPSHIGVYGRKPTPARASPRIPPVTGLAASGRAAILSPRGSSHGTMFCRTAGVRRRIVWTLPRAILQGR